MDFLNDFGIKPVLLLAQIVNFAILLLILKRFLYKPILKVLEERKQKIAEGLKNAEEIEKKLNQISQDREEKLREAAKDAEEMIKDATVNANQIITEAHSKAASDAEKIVERSKQSLDVEREKLRQEMRAELAELVVLSLEKVIGKSLKDKDQKELIEKSLKEGLKT